jgi:hypothetical protein
MFVHGSALPILNYPVLTFLPGVNVLHIKDLKRLPKGSQASSGIHSLHHSGEQEHKGSWSK